MRAFPSALPGVESCVLCGDRHGVLKAQVLGLLGGSPEQGSLCEDRIYSAESSLLVEMVPEPVTRRQRRRFKGCVLLKQMGRSRYHEELRLAP